MSEFDRAPSRMNNLTVPSNVSDRVTVGKTPYSQPNQVMLPASRQQNARINGVSYQGYTFNIVNGGSTQNLQLPGDCNKLLGVCASWDNTTFPGFNNVIELSVNNQGILNAINVAFLNINRFLVDPGYIALNKVVSPTSLMIARFTNGTGITLTNFNLIIAYA